MKNKFLKKRAKYSNKNKYEKQRKTKKNEGHA